MKHKVSELEGALLDAAVALAEGFAQFRIVRDDYEEVCVLGPYRAEDSRFDWCPSTAWEQGGPIIERERIKIAPMWDDTWQATPSLDSMNEDVAGDPYPLSGPTPLIAAMRAYVASKMGDEVELP